MIRYVGVYVSGCEDEPKGDGPRVWGCASIYVYICMCVCVCIGMSHAASFRHWRRDGPGGGGGAGPRRTGTDLIPPSLIQAAAS
ncbi:hypothetical protein HanPI659440_Chr11g0441521 [Helianthus annuus]|nr:hypothetical protein HanPI659440_Chr11g0441521 [Helianthus annuus]